MSMIEVVDNRLAPRAHLGPVVTTYKGAFPYLPAAWHAFGMAAMVPWGVPVVVVGEIHQARLWMTDRCGCVVGQVEDPGFQKKNGLYMLALHPTGGDRTGNLRAHVEGLVRNGSLVTLHLLSDDLGPEDIDN